MQILNCNTSVCKKVIIPSPSKTISTPNITVVVDKPAGLKIASANVSHGTIADNIWTIVALPAGEDAVLDVCFNPEDCDVSPTGKSGNVTISTTANETNLDNNVMPFTLEYITCGEIGDCVDTVTAAAFGATDDILTITNSDASIFTPTLRSIPLSTSTVFVSEAGGNAVPIAGDLRKTFTMADAAGETLAATQEIVLLPGQHTLSTSLVDARRFSAMKGADVTFTTGDPFGIAAGEDYDISLGNVVVSGYSPLNSVTEVGTFTINFNRLESNNIWWDGFPSDTVRVKGSHWIQNDNYGMYVTGTTTRFHAEFDRVSDIRTNNAGADCMFTFNYGTQTASNTDSTLKIGTFQWGPVKQATTALGHPPFRFGANLNVGYVGTNNTYSLYIDRMLDDSTGGDCVGCNYLDDYVAMGANNNNGFANSIVALRAPNTDANTINFSVNSGYFASPIMIVPLFDGSTSPGATNSTFNIDLGIVEMNGDALVISDPAAGVTGAVNLSAKRATQIADQCIIKIGSNDIDKYSISGHWEVIPDHVVIFTKGEDLHLYDVTLANGGTENWIESDAACTVYCYGGTNIPADRVNTNVTLEYVDVRTNTGALTVTTNAIGEGTFTIGNTAFVSPNIILTLTDGGEMRTIHLVSTAGNVVNFIAYNASGPLNAISVDVNWSY